MIFIYKAIVLSQTEEDKDVTSLLKNEIGIETELIQAIKLNIKMKEEKVINIDGEAAGYLLNNFHKWHIYEEPLFYSLDGYSHLLYQLHYFIFETPYLKELWQAPKKDLTVLFLNRIYCENNTIENHQIFLQALQEKFDLIIYSFGTTELGDVDFPDEYTDDFCLAIEKQLLTNGNGWYKDSDVDFYFWKKA